MRNFLFLGLLSMATTGCSVISVADAAVTVVGTTVDVAAAGVKAATGSGEAK